MRGLSLWQPWASLVAVGAKKIETRSWSTTYRGPVAIHAAGRLPPRRIPGTVEETMIEALHCSVFASLPRGAFVALVDLVHVVPSETFILPDAMRAGVYPHMPTQSDRERLFGDYGPGRHAWVLQQLRRLPDPIRAPGRQGLWNLEPALAATITAAANQERVS